MAQPAADPIALACRRRLADDRLRRWLWALGSGLLCTGIPWLMGGGLAVLAWHAFSRRTLAPALYGLTLFGGFAFVLATFDAVLTAPTLGAAATGSPAGWPPVMLLAGVGVFAFGHRQGQERAARDGRRWLDLDR